ncbi:uncharacterized protein LOC110065273 [Orbicella faveolata]|uniref:uncharacterized protein LOC110065273 n=1 Tax=Orbicella faveolata TaxID=48498 RepID=UPI0009E26397|nr:uncharacterized protein LOC110065273 [Orbicella faveolata]
MAWQQYRRICSPFLLILWIFTLFNNVKGVPSDSVVTKARCYANCLTQNTPANETEKTCQTSTCKECLIPCGVSFSDEDTCKRSCNNASSCLKSCEFLAQLQNFSSILAGDGSFPPKPSIPIVTSRNFTSISLKWDPVRNTSGAVVYLIEMTFTGEQSRFSPRYLSEVFVSSQATVKFEHPCVYL